MHDPLVDFFADKPKIWLPDDPVIKNAYEVYGPSFQTVNLLSEEDRNVYGESCKSRKDEKTVERLQYLCIETLAETFTGGALDERLRHDNLVLFGEKLDIHKPLSDLIELECDPFWKRVVQAMVSHPVEFLQLCQNPDTNWKQEGVQLKLAEVVQETCPEDFDLEHLTLLSSKVSTSVNSLSLRHLKSLKKHEHRYKDEDLDYAPIEVCHHCSLEFLKVLTNLHTLSIQFSPSVLFRNYKREAFDCSYEDLENLAKGIKNLSSLKCLKITNSRLDSIKMDTLMNSFQASVQLNHIDFSNCALTGDSAISLGFFIAKSSTLKHIELEGNLLDEQGVRCIAYGLQKTASTDMYLGLSRNPMGNDGITELGAGLSKGKNVTELNISGVDIQNEGAYRVAHIVQLGSSLKKMDISCIKFSDNAGDALVAAMKDNRSILVLECRGCDLTEKQEFNLGLLVQRNQFYAKNPCMKKETFTKEDEREIEAWFRRVKHPLLLECEAQKSETKVGASPVVPRPIPEDLRRKMKRSTAELLGLSSLAQTCTFDTFISRKHLPRSIIKSQNTKYFDDLEGLSPASRLRTLATNDFNAPYYF